MTMTTPCAFDISNLHVRKVITPDGEGELCFKDKDDPNYFYVMVRIDGKKPAQFKRYEISKLQEVTNG